MYLDEGTVAVIVNMPEGSSGAHLADLKSALHFDNLNDALVFCEDSVLSRALQNKQVWLQCRSVSLSLILGCSRAD